MMDIDSLKTVGGGGVVTVFAGWVLKNWFTREQQSGSLYKTEVDAHKNTREQLEIERTLRRGLEVELRQARDNHDADRESWFVERQTDREARQELQIQIEGLRDEVRGLNNKLHDIQVRGGLS